MNQYLLGSKTLLAFNKRRSLFILQLLRAISTILQDINLYSLDLFGVAVFAIAGTLIAAA
ncbi:MAG: hypothetical protein AAGE84_05560 [Cyanobacteria bacterium P01_G01_bin.39]